MRSPGASAAGPAGQEPRAGLELPADLELRAELRLTPGITVLTGGQTGVDTLAVHAALGAALPVHAVFPRGFRQEDGPLTPERRAELHVAGPHGAGSHGTGPHGAGPHGAVLHQLASTGFAQRTWTCVSLADAVLLLDPAGGEGCQETVRAAERLERPLLDLTEAPDPAGVAGVAGDVGSAVRSFLSVNGAQVLMIAGCRGSLLGDRTEAVRAQLAAVAAVLVEWQEERLR